MNFINNLKIRNKLTVMLIFPVLGLLYFSILEMRQKAGFVSEVNILQPLVRISTSIGALVHELQKERGMTGVFMSSKGTKLLTELNGQRSEVDKRVAELKSILDTIKAERYGSEFKNNLHAALDKLSKLDSHRGAASTLSIPASEGIGYYTGANALFLQVVANITKVSSDAEISKLVLTYLNLMQEKEKTGIERAIMSNVFGFDKFTGEEFAKFIKALSAEEIHHATFLNFAHQEQIDFYNSKMRGEFTEESARMTRLALEKSEQGGFGVDAAYWYRMMTGRINLLKEVEDRLSGDLNSTEGQLKGKARTELIIFIVIAAVAVIMSIFLAYIVICSITYPLNQMVEISKKVSAGNLDVAIELKSRDEVGTLADAFREMIVYMKAMAQAADSLSQGKLDIQLAAKGRQDVLSNSFLRLLETLRALLKETGLMVESAKQGMLSQRGQAGDFHGVYGQLVQGINETLDAVVGPITEAAGVLEKVAAKDMTVRMRGDYKGDLTKIKNSLNEAVENLDRSLQQVAMGAGQVASASEQIGSGSQVLAQGTSEQASSLEEVSSSLQEMTSMTKQNTANAREAKGLSDAAKKGADMGVSNMKTLSAAVDKIKKSSDDTAKIVKTIDEIAFQTNLLALNAAVEAARAGDAGKGFAVVAEEVRNLAMRSAEAAKNTANMIEESVKNAANGVNLNLEVMKNFEEINSQVSKVSEVMAEIAAASEQQLHGIEQVSTAVQQMSQLTQQSAANSEESASAAQELSAQAQEMQTMVSSFTVSGDAGKARLTHTEKAGKKPQKMPGAGGAHKDPASVIPFGDDKKGLSSF